MPPAAGNLPEFSFGGTTPGCHHPWDLTRNPGGWSGGSAAADHRQFLTIEAAGRYLPGIPTLSLPSGFSTSPAGLPIGLEVSGLPFTDGTVLAVAHAYPARDRVPQSVIQSS